MAATLVARRQTLQSASIWIMFSIGWLIGTGSFLFHTIPSRLTMALDVVPIAVFMTGYMFWVCRVVYDFRRGACFAIVGVVVAVSFGLLPFREPFNGSLFYLPAMLTFSVVALTGNSQLKKRMSFVAVCFTIAVMLRSIDWIVPWSLGTHFGWHMLTSMIMYQILMQMIEYRVVAND
ncbi:MAG: hypothetical protein AAF664_11305 [Planctomycetota bacterium]